MVAERSYLGGVLALANRTSSIRFRIVLLVIIAAAPLLYERVRLLEAGRAAHIEAAAARTLELARFGVDKQDDLLLSVQSILQTVGHAAKSLPLDARECNRFLSATASDVPAMKALAIVDAAGRVACSSNPQTIGHSEADQPQFQHAIAKGGFTVGRFAYPRARSAPALMATYGKNDANGSVDTVIHAIVDLKWMSQLAAILDQQPGAMALLMNAGGNVLAAHPTPDAWIGRDIADYPLVRAATAQPQGTLTASDFDGVRRIWGFKATADGSARLLVGIDERIVLSAATRETAQAYLGLAVIMALVLLVAWMFGERTILAPIRLLARAAERIGRGELSVRTVGLNWAPEFQPLTRSLDSMAARLAMREQNLMTESQRFKELATLDSLTGLSNRRAFDAELAAEWRQAAERRAALSLLMIDVDHFKRFNDRYGHVEGDACLRAVGAILSGATFAEGRAARYGGEEFALVLPSTDRDSAYRLAEQIRLAVAGLRIPHVDAPVGYVTVSIGLATLTPMRGDAVERLVTAADAALYASKGPRNTVTVHQAPTLALAS